MIQDLSQTLRSILTQPGLPAPLSTAQIVFDRPSDPFTPSQTTVDMFLYDMRENLELRLNELWIEKNGSQSITHKAPLRLACSYLVTAWPTGGVDPAFQEQQLLSQVLQTLAHYPTIPANFLQGAMVGQIPPLPMVALHPDALKNLSEFWTSLGNKLRPSLTMTVTISMPVFDNVVEFLVTTSTASAAPAAASQETWLQIGGRVVDPLSNGVAGALVDVIDAGLRTQTGADGRFTFTRIPAGSHTLRVVAVGFQPQTRTVIVPGRPEDYQVTLTPL